MRDTHTLTINHALITDIPQSLTTIRSDPSQQVAMLAVVVESRGVKLNRTLSKAYLTHNTRRRRQVLFVSMFTFGRLLCCVFGTSMWRVNKLFFRTKGELCER